MYLGTFEASVCVWYLLICPGLLSYQKLTSKTVPLYIFNIKCLILSAFFTTVTPSGWLYTALTLTCYMLNTFLWLDIHSCHYNTKHERLCLTTFSNTEKIVENMTHSGVFWTKFELFGDVVKHCLECLYLFSI